MLPQSDSIHTTTGASLALLQSGHCLNCMCCGLCHINLSVPVSHCNAMRFPQAWGWIMLKYMLLSLPEGMEMQLDGKQEPFLTSSLASVFCTLH